MEWVDCVRAGQHLWLCVVQDSGSGQPLVAGQCCGSQLGNTFDWFDSSSSHNYWARNNEIIPTFFKPLRICFCSIEHSQSKTLDIKCNMKTTSCSKVHCFIIDLRTTRMFSHLYIEKYWKIFQFQLPMALFQLFLAELSRASLHPLPHIIIVQSQRRMDTHWKLLKDWF